MTVYATLFDGNYLGRGAVCIRSLARQAGRPIRVLVLVLDDRAAALLPELLGRLPASVVVEIMTLPALERRWPTLAAVRAGRPVIEYYFTVTPFLCREAVARLGPGERAVYVDADFYFFADPEPALDGTAGKSVVLTEHRFPPRLDHLARLYGRFNVGWLAFDGSPEAAGCLEDWSADCLRSCADVPADGVFGDQKYLDKWPATVANLAILDHPGVNAGPWNVVGRRVGLSAAGATIDGHALIAYHFHRVARLRAGLYEIDWDGYGPLSWPLIRHVYAPYLSELAALEAVLGDAPSVRLRSSAPAHSVTRRTVRALRRAWRALVRERVLFDKGVPLAPILGALHA